jgi:hypothetical protein
MFQYFEAARVLGWGGKVLSKKKKKINDVKASKLALKLYGGFSGRVN